MRATLHLALDRSDGSVWGTGDTPSKARDAARAELAATPPIGAISLRAHLAVVDTDLNMAEEDARWERDLRVVRVEATCEDARACLGVIEMLREAADAGFGSTIPEMDALEREEAR